MSSSPKIYEFSTGIYIEQLDDGSWRSRGFTGNWMHNTFGKRGIPEPIEQAIANKLFAVAEGDYSFGAIIGRVVKFSEEQEWSVIAIVTSITDNFGRNLSVYRYFCCEGQASLIKLIDCLENYAQQHQQLPIFNPFNSEKKLSQYWSNSIQSLGITQSNQTDIFKLIDIKQCPLTLAPNSYSLREIHNLAAKKTDNLSAIAWAYNVQTLTRPESFLVIQAADENAYHYLHNLVSNESNKFITGIDEQGLKTVFQELTNTDLISEQSSEKLKNLWIKSYINSEFLRRIFNSLGMRSVINGNMHYVLIKIFELGSFLISDETAVLEYFLWRQQYYRGNVVEVLQNFRKEIRAKLSKTILLDRNLHECFVNNSLKLLLNKKIQVLDLFLLLTNEQDSLWANKITIDCFYDRIYSLISNIDTLIQEQHINKNPLLLNSISAPLYNYIKSIPSSYRSQQLKKISRRQSSIKSKTYYYSHSSLIQLYWLYIKKTWSDINQKWDELQHNASLEKNIPQPCKYYKDLASLLGMLAKYDSRFAKLHEYFLYVIGSIRAYIYYSPINSN